MFNASLHKSLKFTSPLTMMTWQIEKPLKVCNFDKYVKLFLELFDFFLIFLKTESPCVSFLVVSLSAETFTLFMAMKNNGSFIRADEDGGKDEIFFPLLLWSRIPRDFSLPEPTAPGISGYRCAS